MVSLLLLPLYTRYLSPADYGVMELLDLTVNVVGMLIGTRVGQALFYFYFAANEEKDRERWVGTAFLGAVILGVASAFLFVPAAGRISLLVFGTAQYAPYFRLLFVSFAFSLPVEIGYSCMRMFGRSSAYARTQLFALFGAAVLNVVFLVVLHLGLKSMLLSALITSALLASYMAWYTLRPIGINFDFRLLGRLLKYSLPLSLGGLALFFVHYGDRGFLRVYVSLDELGVYSLAYKLGMLITFLYAPFALHWNARVAAIVQEPGSESTYIRSLTYLTATLTFAVVALTLFVEPVLKLLVSPAFYGAAPYVPWIATAYLLRSVGAHFQGIFTAEGKPGSEGKVNIVGAIACVSAYAVLIPRYKVWGAVAATVFGFFVILVYSFFEAQRVRHFHFEYSRLLRIAVSGSAMVALFYLLRPANFWMETGLATLMTGSYVVVLLFGCFGQEERNSATSMLSATWKRLFSRSVPTAVAA
jgi:O-antigen/teichoic acid export membrane protein